MSEKEARLSLDDVGAGVARVDSLKKITAEDLQTQKLLNEELRARIESRVQDTWMRKIYAAAVFLYLLVYSLCVLVILFLAGTDKIKLPDNVLVVLAGSTAVAAIGLVSQVGRGLFPSFTAPPPTAA